LSVAEIQARRAARKAAAAEAREKQLEIDLEALDMAEVEHGDGRVLSLELPAHVDGLPTMVVVHTPEPKYFSRFRDMARKQHSKPGAALDMLASMCVAYPADDVYKRVCEAFPGTHDAVGAAAIKLAEAKESDSGKD
jgi:hypothetical protein